MRNAMRALGLGLCLTAGCAASVGTSELSDAGRDAQGPDGAGPDAPPAMPTVMPPTSCARTDGTVRISMRRMGRTFGPCEGLMPTGTFDTVDLEARVASVTATELRLDTCRPGLDCDDGEVVFTLEAGGAALDAFVRPGEFVAVRYAQGRNFRCTQQINVRQLPEWGGVTNPAGPGRRLRFAASEGLTGLTMSGAMELSVNPRLACPAGAGAPSCGGPGPGSYELAFLPINGTPEVVVPMGASRELLLGTNEEQQTVRAVNLRSYESGACDDYWNYAWWVGAVR